MNRKGLSLVELTVAVGIVTTILGLAVPVVLTSRATIQTRAAARVLATRVMAARSQAMRLGASVGLRFEEEGEPGAGVYRLTTYVDGDGDGVLSSDMATGVDPMLNLPEPALAGFPQVRFGLLPSVPAVGAPAVGADERSAVRLGRSGILSVSPFGTSSSGTLYLRGNRGPQYAVRVFGATARVSVLRFNFQRRQWEAR